MSVIDVNTVATDRDLVGRHRLVTTTLPNETDRDRVRQLAMDDVEGALQQRRPPVYPANLTNVSELRDAVVFRTLYIIFQQGVSHEGDAHYVQMREFEKAYRAEMKRTFTVGQYGTQSPPRTISVYRG